MFFKGLQANEDKEKMKKRREKRVVGLQDTLCKNYHSRFRRYGYDYAGVYR
jgi:hypothetical protein